MHGTLLIADGVATNRILLKAKLAPSSFDVAQADTAADLIRAARNHQPALIVLADTLPDARAQALCAELKADPDLSAIPIIAIARSATQTLRLQFLRAGADEVFTYPLPDSILHARVRSLIRARTVIEELTVRDGTARALGFAEAQDGFARPAHVAIMAHEPAQATRWRVSLAREMLGAQLTAHGYGPTRSNINHTAPPDVFVIGLEHDTAPVGLRMLADLRAHPSTRHAGIVAVLDGGSQQTLAADALDLGAGDVMLHGFDAQELKVRLNSQILQKRTQDQLRNTVESGLRAAMQDPMTGLYNRRYAMPYLSRLISQITPSGRGFALMLADLDHFKRVNDRFGHAAGDAVLTEAARRLKDDLRAEDLIARIGGEEFLIVMPDASRQDAHIAAERLRDRINATPFDLPDGAERVSVTVSIGVAVCCAECMAEACTATSAEALLRMADAALYTSKGAGRNQVTMVDAA